MPTTIAMILLIGPALAMRQTVHRPSEADAALRKLCEERCFDNVRSVQKFEELGCDRCADPSADYWEDTTIVGDMGFADHADGWKNGYLTDEVKTKEMLQIWRLPPQTTSASEDGGKTSELTLNSESSVEGLGPGTACGPGKRKSSSCANQLCHGAMSRGDVTSRFTVDQWRLNYGKITRRTTGGVSNILVASEGGDQTAFAMFYATPTTDSTLRVYLDWICSSQRGGGWRMFGELQRVLRQGYPMVDTICVKLMVLGGRQKLFDTYTRWGFKELSEDEGIDVMEQCFPRAVGGSQSQEKPFP